MSRRRKHSELANATGLMRAFLDANTWVRMHGLEPRVEIDEAVSYYGYYPLGVDDWETMYVNLKKCELSTNRNRPGHVKDVTVTGVVMHEFGHMLHHRSYIRGQGYLYAQLNRRFKQLRREPLIHFYGMEIEEDIAESIRMFILNPRLLEKGRPKRFAILKDYMDEVDAETHIEIGPSTVSDFFTECWIAGRN